MYICTVHITYSWKLTNNPPLEKRNTKLGCHQPSPIICSRKSDLSQPTQPPAYAVVVQPLQLAVANATDATPAAPHQQRIAREGPAAALGLEDLDKRRCSSLPENDENVPLCMQVGGERNRIYKLLQEKTMALAITSMSTFTSKLRV